MHLPHAPEKGRDRKLTEIVRRSLANSGITPYGTDLPRVGFLPHDDTGIMLDVLCENCESSPVSAFLAEPLIYSGHLIADALEEGRISEAVAYSRFREWREAVLEWMHGWGFVDSTLRFEDLIDYSIFDEIWDAAYGMDDGGAWIYSSGMDPLSAAVEMPLESSIDDIAAVAALHKPNAFLCFYDYDGIYIYASPRVQNCAPSKLHGNSPAVGDILVAGPHPTFVLPERIQKDALEQADAGGYVHDS
jgi:hypothetical protein